MKDASPESGGPMDQRRSGSAVRAALELLRVPHWVKNLIVLLPVLFAARFADPAAWRLALLAAAAFCLASSAMYVLNDILDRESDRYHPAKRDRPIASGRIGTPAAVAEMAVLLAGAGALSVAVSTPLAAVVLGYLLLQVLYNLLFKWHMLTDAICLSLGFVLRAVGGAVAIRVEVSPWLLVCSFAVCLFLGFCKRHCEVVSVGQGEAVMHRKTLACYTPGLLNHLITLSGAVAMVCFLLYATSELTINRFGTNYFIYTSPLVFYGIGRFAMLSMKGAYSDPTEMLLRDRGIQATTMLWLAACAVIIKYGREIQQWVAAHGH